MGPRRKVEHPPRELQAGSEKAMKVATAYAAQANPKPRGHRPNSASARPASISSAGRYARAAVMTAASSSVFPTDHAIDSAKADDEATTMRTSPPATTATLCRRAGPPIGLRPLRYGECRSPE
jgi:hypothetical protein